MLAGIDDGDCGYREPQAVLWHTHTRFTSARRTPISGAGRGLANSPAIHAFRLKDDPTCPRYGGVLAAENTARLLQPVAPTRSRSSIASGYTTT